jgi:SAM-dependent MidA family methyltransferase
LRRRIREEGPISFAAFMEAALYDEDGGFYARGQRLGARGAFATAPTQHGAFAAAVRHELLAAYEAFQRPTDFAVVDVGAGDGTLAAALAPTAAAIDAELVLVERAQGMRQAQERALSGSAARVRWVAEPEAVSAETGFVVANEVFDDLPCHLVEWPHEVLVGVDSGGRLTEVLKPADGRLLTLVSEPRPGGRYAVCPQAPAFLARLERAIGAGRILILDYGGEGADVHSGLAPVRTFLGGRPGGGPLQAPGTQNITSDVDFAVLRRAASSLGLRELTYEPQPAWLRSQGVTVPPTHLRTDEDWRLAALVERLSGFQALLLEKLARFGARSSTRRALPPR